MDDTTIHFPVFQPLRLRMQPGGHAVDLTRPDLLLGRHSEADLRLPLPDVSRHHCRFVYSEAGWEVIDLASLNGVFVNGARVGRAMLQRGDQIRIGGLELEVEDAAETPEAQVLRSIAETIHAGDVPQRKAS